MMGLGGSRDNNADADVLSMLEDPKGVTAEGAGQSLEALVGVLMLSENSWSDMV